MKKSSFGKLNWNDALKGCIVAGITGGLTVLYSGLQTGVVDYKLVLSTSITAMVGYLLKNVFES